MFWKPEQEEITRIPVGTIMIWPSESIPDEYLECDGSAVLRSTYYKLFEKIGTTWGAGDGSTFNVPDLRGTFLRGFDHSKGYDPGRVFASYQAPNLGWPCLYAVSSGGWVLAGGSDVRISLSGDDTCDLRPKNHAIMFCIKYDE